MLPGVDVEQQELLASEIDHAKHERFVLLQLPRVHPHKNDTMLGEHWWLIHSVTHEKVKLQAPSGTWLLTFDNDGFATLHDAADVELGCCNLFKIHLLTAHGGAHLGAQAWHSEAGRETGQVQRH